VIQPALPEIIGIEMEGAGLSDAYANARLDWVVIKAICDIADGCKAGDIDARQAIAAPNPAAFVAVAMSLMPLYPETGDLGIRA
jgi:nucleoside phosphorylase